MNRRRPLIRTMQIGLLLLAAVLLFYWWRVRPAVIVSDDMIDDLIEEVGDTYVQVHVGEIQRGTLRQYVTVYGTVLPAAASAGQGPAIASISSPTVAAVATVNCIEGQHVAKGEVLFSLDTRAADAAIDQTRRIVVADQTAADNIAKPAPTTAPAWRVIISQRQLAADQAALDLAKSQRTLLAISAPIAGTVTNLNIAVGETAQPAKPALEIVDLNRLVATVDVPATDLPDLHPGQSAAIDLRTADQATQPMPLVGEILLVDSTINPSTGMGSADITVPDGAGLRPGQFVRCEITTGEASGRLFVPTQSITQNQKGDAAIGRVETDGRWAVLVPIQTGLRDGGNTEIQGVNLEPGQPIVTTGANGLVQRTRLYLLRD